MISVLTMTYQRHHILEEAIHSYLQNNLEDTEMVVLNDSPEVSYYFNHPNIRVINHPTRFATLGQKLAFGFEQCRGEYIYRLDDDDLLTPFALDLVKEQVKNDADIFRSNKAYLIMNGISHEAWSNVNNGSCYRAEWLKSIKVPDTTIVEDKELTFESGGRIYTDSADKYTMIYRWNMDTYHISGAGVENANNPNLVFNYVDMQVQKESGEITLNPHFRGDYYKIINI